MNQAHSQRPFDENGKPLEVKEGVVVDQNGNELTSSPRSRGHHERYRDPFTGQPRTVVFKTTNPLAPFIIVPLIVIAVGVGITLFTGVAVAAFAAWLVFSLFRMLRRL